LSHFSEGSKFEQWRSQGGSFGVKTPIGLGKKKFFMYFPLVTNITIFNIMQTKYQVFNINPKPSPS